MTVQEWSARHEKVRLGWVANRALGKTPELWKREHLRATACHWLTPWVGEDPTKVRVIKVASRSVGKTTYLEDMVANWPRRERGA